MFNSKEGLFVVSVLLLIGVFAGTFFVNNITGDVSGSSSISSLTDTCGPWRTITIQKESSDKLQRINSSWPRDYVSIKADADLFSESSYSRCQSRSCPSPANSELVFFKDNNLYVVWMDSISAGLHTTMGSDLTYTSDESNIILPNPNSYSVPGTRGAMSILSPFRIIAPFWTNNLDNPSRDWILEFSPFLDTRTARFGLGKTMSDSYPYPAPQLDRLSFKFGIDNSIKDIYYGTSPIFPAPSNIETLYGIKGITSRDKNNHLNGITLKIPSRYCGRGIPAGPLN